MHNTTENPEHVRGTLSKRQIVVTIRCKSGELSTTAHAMDTPDGDLLAGFMLSNAQLIKKILEDPTFGEITVQLVQRRHGRYRYWPGRWETVCAYSGEQAEQAIWDNIPKPQQAADFATLTPA